MSLIWRVQDRHGRGPFRPGFSGVWTDPDGPSLPPPFYHELGWSLADIDRLHQHGLHLGCGCSSASDLLRWFTPRELATLARLGFEVVTIKPDKIIAETATQVVFGCRKPLAKMGKRRALAEAQHSELAPPNSGGA